jgi:hypothetical protein
MDFADIKVGIKVRVVTANDGYLASRGISGKLGTIMSKWPSFAPGGSTVSVYIDDKHFELYSDEFVVIEEKCYTCRATTPTPDCLECQWPNGNTTVLSVSALMETLPTRKSTP